MQTTNSKLNTILLIILIILVGVGIYVLASKKNSNDQENSEVSQIQESVVSNNNIQTDTKNSPSINIGLKTYQGNGFSFKYSGDPSIKLTTLPSISYVELKTGDLVSIRFYPDSKNTSTQDLNWFTNVVIINGKTFKYGDVQTEDGIYRSYLYTKNGKAMVIEFQSTIPSIIDLGSVEIK